MKRYDVIVWTEDEHAIEFWENHNGHWVKWEDAKKSMRKRDNALARVRDSADGKLLEARREIVRLKEENALLRQEIYDDEEDTMRYLKAEVAELKTQNRKLREKLAERSAQIVELDSFVESVKQAMTRLS